MLSISLSRVKTLFFWFPIAKSLKIAKEIVTHRTLRVLRVLRAFRDLRRTRPNATGILTTHAKSALPIFHPSTYPFDKNVTHPKIV